MSETFYRIVKILLVASCAAVASVTALSAAEFVKPKDYNKKETWRAIEEKYPGVGVVRILDELHLRVSPGGKISVERHTLDAIMDLEKADEFTSGTVPYSAEMGWNLGWLRARTINEDGTISELEESNRLVRALAEDYVLYSDDKELAYSFPNVKPHSLLETLYTLSTDSPIWRWTYWLGYFDVPTVHARIEVEFPGRRGSEQDVDWSATCRTYSYGTEDAVPEPRETFEKGKTRLVWSIDSIPAIATETYLPPADWWHPRITVNPAGKNANPREFGVWYWKKLLAERIAAPENIKQKALALVSSYADEAGKVDALYKHVQQLRYVALYLGKGGFQPHFVSEVDQAGYGDCKDKAALLISLLRSVGIPAYPALALSKYDGRVEREIFEPGHFNHMIVLAKGKDASYWLDPTASFCLSDRLPQEEQGVNAMVLEERGGYIAETPRYPQTRCAINGRATVSSAQGDSIKMGVEERFDFPVSMWEREACARASLIDVRRGFKDAWSARNRDAAVDSLTLFELEKRDSVFALCYRVSIPYKTSAGGGVAVPVERLMIPRSFPNFGAPERKHSIWLRGVHSFEDTLEVADPTGRWKIEPGEEALVEGPPGTFQMKISRLGERLLLVRKFTLKRSEFEASEYGVLRSFFDNVRLHTRRYRLSG